MLTTIRREKIDPNAMYGLVISESKRLLLLAKECDLQFDGFAVIRKGDITERIITDSNKYCSALMKKEGNWAKIPPCVKRLNVSTWDTLISGIKSDVIILEDERKNGDFYIGPVIGMTKTNVTLNWFDGVGAWGTPDKVPFKKITICKFLDRYSPTHAKYLKWT